MCKQEMTDDNSRPVVYVSTDCQGGAVWVVSYRGKAVTFHSGVIAQRWFEYLTTSTGHNAKA